MQSPIFWYQQGIVDGNPMQMGYNISSYYNTDDGVLYEYYEDLEWIYSSDEENDSYRADNTSPILLGPMTKQEFDTPDFLDIGGTWDEVLHLNIHTSRRRFTP